MQNQRGKIQHMAELRKNGRVEKTSYETQKASLQAVDAANWRQPPLPPSPCIKVKATGEIHEWAPFFASRPDLCENCDEYGNTNPAAWQGRRSPHYEDNIHKQGMPMAPMGDLKPAEKQPEATLPSAPPLPPPPGLLFYMDEFTAGLLEQDQPQMGSAHIILGVPQSVAKDYSQYGVRKAAMPLVKMGGGVPVGDAIQNIYNNTV